jgi:AraC-like DNA-binding protein
MKHYKSLFDLHRENNLPPPENPLVSMYRCNQQCSMGDREFTSDFYMIGFKKLKSGVILYGRTKYDHENGSMMFVKPRQVIQMKNLEFDEDGFLLFFHEDFLNGYSLHSEIQKYHFFDYETNEALHLSPKEEQIIWNFYNVLSAEYFNNEDEFSRELMLANISSILKYAQRFYKRQFINRTEISGKTVTKFNEALSKYFSDGQLHTKGLPTVSFLSEELHLSSRYLSDLLKQESGKTALELIHIYLVSEAKNLLKTDEQSVSEIAYALGFENMSYFSRLFKKEVGVSPVQFKKQLLN